jgi:hypothetical protein
MQQAQLAPIALSDDDAAPDVLSAITISPGAVDGRDNMFHPKDGDTVAGGHGNPIRRIQCATMEYLNDYHVHAFLGVLIRGKEVAIPDSIGLVNPGTETNGYISSAQCFYYIHTHDASGLIHIEDPKVLSPSAVAYVLGDFLDVWGLKTATDHFGAFKGPIKVFIGNVPEIGKTQVTSYTGFKNVAHLRSIPLRSHEAIWIEVGKPFVAAKRLPPVTFYTEY